MKGLTKLGLLGIFAATFFSSKTVQAQEHSSNNDVWFHYYGKNKVADKLSLSFEATMRFANGLSEKQQYFIRPSVDYQFTKQLMGTIGYSHYNTYSYGDPAMNKRSIPEDHVWVQGTFVHNSKDLKVSHRLRDEFRYVGVAKLNDNGGYDIDHYDYRNRLRYMLLFTYPLIEKEGGAAKLFTVLGDEIFMNLGSNAGKTFLNQNRIIGGVGYNFDKNHQIQLSYIHQHIWNFSNTLLESNPTVRVSYITNFDWTKS